MWHKQLIFRNDFCYNSRFTILGPRILESDHASKRLSLSGYHSLLNPIFDVGSVQCDQKKITKCL